jgi:hypothetical protein
LGGDRCWRGFGGSSFASMALRGFETAGIGESVFVDRTRHDPLYRGMLIGGEVKVHDADIASVSLLSEVWALPAGVGARQI